VSRRIIAMVSSIIVLTASVTLTAVAHDRQSPIDWPFDPGTRTEFVPGEVIVKLRADVTLSTAATQANRASLNAVLTSVGARQADRVFGVIKLPPQALDLQRIYRVTIDPRLDVLTAAAKLSTDPNVEYAEPNYLAHAAVVPNDPLYASQWALDKINAPAAWNVVTGTPSVVIAVIDSGIDTTHPDLTGRLWFNPGEIPGNGIDDDNNGYIDDVNGWNFVGANNNIVDDNGHGTQVAGVAGASTNNAIGIAGMCWNCRLMIVKAMQAGGAANYSDIAAAVNYAAAKGAQVINLSVGGYTDSATLRAAIDAASSTAVIVGGAGNDNVSAPFYPAAYPNVLSVASTTVSDTKAAFSNYGSWIDVAAPGVAISTTFSGGDYGASEGTSLSAPLVAGLAGLIKSAHPDWSPALVRAQIMHTTDAITEAQLGSGRINAATAMLPPQPLFSMAGYTLNGTPNGRPDLNSGNALIVSVSDDWLDAPNVVATLSESDPFVTVITGTSSFGNIASGATQSSTPFSFTVAGAGYNHPIAFSLNLSANSGAYTATLPLTITTRSDLQSVSGVLPGDTVWTNDKTYVVNGNILVPVSTTLSIQPGTTVRFNGYYELIVKGQLIASGTPQQRIRFTSNKPAPQPGDWQAIVFGDESVDAVIDLDGNYVSGSIMAYAEFEYGGALLSYQSSPYIAENYFHDNIAANNPYSPGYPWDTSVVTLYGSHSPFTHNTINNNRGGGVKIEGPSDITITNSIIQDNVSGQWAGGITCLSGNCTILYSIIQNNDAHSFSGGVFSYSGNVTLRSNLIANNRSASQTQSDRGGSAFGTWGGIISATNNTIIGNSAFAAFHFNNGSTLDSITSNNIINNTGTTNPFYAVYLNAPYAAQNISMTQNFWGTTNTGTIDVLIYDFLDNFNLGQVVYQPVLANPISSAPAFLWNAAVVPNPVGIQPATFTLTFSAPMDQSINPIVAFGMTQPYTSFAAQDNAQWISDRVWRANYDVTSLVPRGVYTISVSGVKGLDGMPIPTDTQFGFTVDYAGSITDQTPPPAPSLNVDFCANSTTSIGAQWSAYDPNSVITLYRYALGSAANSVEVINWTDIGNTSVTRTGLSLNAGQRYYFSVKARNAGGLWSAATSRSFIVGVPCQKVYLPLVRK
jgi:thermitase